MSNNKHLAHNKDIYKIHTQKQIIDEGTYTFKCRIRMKNH
jgi:hypothetical protein